MDESTITAKGQTTVPHAVRERLGVGPGTKLLWHVTPDGGLIVRAKTHSLRDLGGSVKVPGKPSVSIDKMNPWR